MSLIRTCLPTASGPPDQSLHEWRKAVLSCPRCGREAPLTGDWLWLERDHGTEIRCPNCDELLTVRKRFDRSP